MRTRMGNNEDADGQRDLNRVVARIKSDRK